jgi:biopolymer transport protein ExbD
MKLKTKVKREYDDDGLLPLVNIIFLLLIFFMIVGVIEKNIIKENLQLPRVSLERFENKEVTKIFLDAENNLFINDKNIDISQLKTEIKTLGFKDVVIVADKTLLYSDISRVLLELKKNKIDSIKLLSSINAN